MSSPVNISLIETAKLELAGAEHRLDVARQNYRAFVEEHGAISDGLLIYSPVPSPQMRMSLEHERESLECELDAARRQVAHCSEVLSDLQLTAAVEDDSVSDLILGPQEADEELRSQE
jgi:hypothetical protein